MQFKDSNNIHSIVFFGTPDFAIPTLEKLLQAPEIKVLAVVTQPDKPTGRKQILTAPPVKTLALEHGIKIYQPEKLNQDTVLIQDLKNMRPDFIITCAYGQIIKSEILNIAPVINLHASLLPDYRGPAPINWSIIHGEKTLGVSTMLSDIGIDTGDVLLKAEMTFDNDQKADSISNQLAELGSELMLKTIREFKNIKPQKQPEVLTEKTLAPFMDKNLGHIEFQAQELNYKSANPKQSDFLITKKNSAINIHNLVRGTYPWPGAYFMRGDDKIILLETKVTPDESGLKPGSIVDLKKDLGSICIQTQEGILEILSLKPQGKMAQRASDWLNGQRLKRGDLL
jgi:methionyl-tRNA formyltransferase